ncbi:hypothetical protein BGZ81_011284 [Podila clonocystis]|nr:hypothetical protein BGZ81_011284 [Podila clonocystis]
MLNRKKAVEVLLETLDAKQKTGEWEMDNPLRLYESYYSVPPRDRVLVLKALVEWVLQEGASIRQGIEDYNEVYMVEPFGTDQIKRVYWYFGGKETNSKKKNASWETVAKDLEELKALASSFNESTSKPERALQERLLTEIIEPAEEKILQREKRQERVEKRMQKLAMFHQMAATRTTRTRSSNRLNQPKYTFEDDEDEEDDEDQYAVYRGPSGRRNTQEESQSLESIQVQFGVHDEEHDHQNQQYQVSGTSSSHDYSGRSSVDRDSDTSISVAFHQKTRVVEDELNSPDRKARHKDQDDDYVFEEDKEDDNDSESSELASNAIAEPIIPSALEPSTLSEDIEMK